MRNCLRQHNELNMWHFHMVVARVKRFQITSQGITCRKVIDFREMIVADIKCIEQIIKLLFSHEVFKVREA